MVSTLCLCPLPTAQACQMPRRSLRAVPACVCVRRGGGGECEPGCLLDAPYFIYSVPACVTLCGVARAGMPLQPHRATTSQRRRSEDWACDARAP
jgi:hypothetical protein